MTKITDNFCGYLKIDADVFTYNVSQHVVTLLPAQIDPVKRYEALDQIRSRNIDSPEYLFGDDNGYRIAMLRNGRFNGSFLGLSSSIQFATPVIIKAAGNASGFYNMLTDDWDKFHAITFNGGNINAICNPQMAIVRPTFDEDQKTNCDGAREIKIRPWSDYTRSFNFEIDGEKATFTISVSQTGEANRPENMEAYSLGELNSFIRFSFENAQDFEKIAKYYKVAKSLIAILTMRNNISFETYLSQRNSDEQYFKTGVCKIFDHYENHSVRKCHNVIPIYNIFDYIPSLLDKIAKNETEPLLALLPENNKRVNQISITNIQDLCTALEVAYNWSKRIREKDSLIESLKQHIKKLIDEFSENHSEIDVNKETTLSSAFQYLDYTLKQKILTMYDENCDAVGAVISKWSLPQVDEANVGSFVKLRNSKTHSGTIEWGDSANLYTALLALEYACLFKYIGLPNEIIKDALLQIF